MQWNAFISDNNILKVKKNKSLNKQNLENRRFKSGKKIV